ncbi:endonuclease/exonuclease/phosphatase family protein [Faucicola boevrei]|uniref:endonuclease/exonuclease/phosphatase family protein n=1 Tax=Faucicola boevrei TaxID=346665 RepID=UPI00039A9835|nr:endonuclease/exonuclease/phosphatase family protein [Moraxella boevrei]
MLTPTFMITSYNIHKGMSPLNREVIIAPIAKALKQLNSDILCLQEVQGQNLKRMIKFNEFPEQSQHDWFGEYLQMSPNYGKNCEYPHGHHGNAVLSRFVLDPKHNMNISVNRLEQRGVLHCEILLPNATQPLTVLNAHLNLLERDRTKQYQAISDYIRHNIAPDAPLILAGDFNDWQQLSMDKLAKNLALQEVFQQHFGKLLPTFPARLPLLSLDRIYVKNLRVNQAWVHTGTPFDKLSDHLPISAELSLL